ncbi:MAG: hypothetical protein Q8N05_07130 [Bacteroidota bacterium]|nr:hypothetical protein [Bacteroidota bacterium]
MEGWERPIMTVIQIIILAIIGLMAGIFSGTFGVGGAIIVIPEKLLSNDRTFSENVW